MRADLAAEPREVIRTLRAMLDWHREEAARIAKELRRWEGLAGVRPGDGSDQPALFDCERQPALFGG